MKYSSENSSHPAGTTVRVSEFLKHIPVRRQTALKTVPKTIAKIRKTLQAYALARPATRLSFKVLKSKNANGDWIYGPKPGNAISDAVLKIAGQDVSAQCISKSRSTRDSLVENGEQRLEEGSRVAQTPAKPYRVTAFLPRLDCGTSVTLQEVPNVD